MMDERPTAKRAMLGLPALLLLCAALQAQHLTVLVTSDMHGWLEPTRDGDAYVGGAAETLAQWRAKEGLKPGQALVLSCGDDYTGPALSTYFKGEPVTDAMNALGYAASALGNHEFDFGVPQLMKLASGSRFRFVACNLTATTADAPALPTQPFCVVTVQGIKVGVLGLTLLQLQGITNSSGWAGTDYAQALRHAAPLARAAGAQVLVVVGHVPFADLKAAADQVRGLGIAAFFGGHSHESTLGQADSGAWVLNPGCFWREYGRVDLDVEGAQARVLSAALVPVRGPKADRRDRMALGLPAWEARLAPLAGPTLGYTATGLPRRWALANLITDAWLAADPTADLALCNEHGIRQDLPAGPVDKLQLLSVLPFEDRLVAVTLSGAALTALLGPAQRSLEARPGEALVPGGLKAVGADWVLMRNGQPLDPAASYRVLTTDYLCDHDPALQGRAQASVAPNWRDPVAAWLLAHPSGEDKPLEGLVDAAARVRE
jgi:2',3'-cyclic-nucleotide 2'-phosphodiesterase (5'-nucleotidase family)